MLLMIFQNMRGRHGVGTDRRLVHLHGSGLNLAHVRCLASAAKLWQTTRVNPCSIAAGRVRRDTVVLTELSLGRSRDDDRQSVPARHLCLRLGA